MTQTFHIGYGQFHLELFHRGEGFARYNGSRGKIDTHAPSLADYLPVWIDLGTSNARRTLLHRHALVHALTPDQARRILRRSRKAKG